MAVGRLPRASVESLVRDHLVAQEDPATANLIDRLREARRRGYLTRGEFLEVCAWKSARSIGHARANNHHRIRRATAAVLGTHDEGARLGALLALQGVGVPTASAILTMLEPKRYGVIDIRVWQLLHALGAVEGNAAGVGLRPDHWLQFLRVLRDVSAHTGLAARTVERSLFAAHRAYQEGLLYRSSNASGPGPESSP
ncbi:MAG: hypothetical protein ACM3PF_09220 [Bacteroidota bacterium]